MSKQGFRVGPQNLPDGTRKRKADRIKEALIQRAKIKSDFRKLQKRRLKEQQDDATYDDSSAAIDGEALSDIEASAPAAPHPDRQALMEEEIHHGNDAVPRQTHRSQDSGKREPFDRMRQHQKLDPYSKEVTRAQQAQAFADQRRVQREEAEQERQARIQNRQRMNKLLKKSRIPGNDGKRKLGRESELLLEKVRKLVGKG